jgi:hypothetical protein
LGISIWQTLVAEALYSPSSSSSSPPPADILSLFSRFVDEAPLLAKMASPRELDRVREGALIRYVARHTQELEQWLARHKGGSFQPLVEEIIHLEEQIGTLGLEAQAKVFAELIHPKLAQVSHDD